MGYLSARVACIGKTAEFQRLNNLTVLRRRLDGEGQSIDRGLGLTCGNLSVRDGCRGEENRFRRKSYGGVKSAEVKVVPHVPEESL